MPHVDEASEYLVRAVTKWNFGKDALKVRETFQGEAK